MNEFTPSQEEIGKLMILNPNIDWVMMKMKIGKRIS